jgi:hypothetical protein
MKDKAHLTATGLEKIIAIKAALNLGLSDQIQKAFPNVVPMARPTYSVVASPHRPLNPHWVSGFSEGDSCFYCGISPQTNQIRCMFLIGLNERETPLLIKIQDFFGGIGVISSAPKNRATNFTVTTRSDLANIIIPCFNQYPFKGNKLTNFLIWSKIVELVVTGAHKTSEGLAQIKELRDQLNK